MNDSQLTVSYTSPALAETAAEFANTYGYTLSDFSVSDSPLTLVFSDEGTFLSVREGKKPIVVRAEFAEGGAAHRRQFGGGKGQAIAKAVGIKGGFLPRVIDATAGLGGDSFVLACLGAQVTLVERSPVVHRLLMDAVSLALDFADKEDPELGRIMNRMKVVSGDGADYLSAIEQSDSPDVVYLDPMFPERRKKTALVKKEMRVFHDIVGTDDDADKLLSAALECARYRVVVKRPRIAPFLANKEPSYQLNGKSSRFDIYTLKALPSV